MTSTKAPYWLFRKTKQRLATFLEHKIEVAGIKRKKDYSSLFADFAKVEIRLPKLNKPKTLFALDFRIKQLTIIIMKTTV